MTIQIPTVDANEQVRQTAFAMLLARARPVEPRELASVFGLDVDPILDALAAAGWIDRGVDGRVTGSAGLSLSDGPHRLAMGAGAFRTWCAYDALGIPAALGADAHIDTACGECGAPIILAVIGGRPTRSGPEVLWLASGRGDLRTSFCTPTVLLCGDEHGAIWARRHENAGELVGLDEAAAQGATAWADCAEAAQRMPETEVEYVGGPKDAEVELLGETPVRISIGAGYYQRSARCADDSRLRYVWQETS